MISKSDFGLILAAAGLGTRFGSKLPKQFLALDDRLLYLWALQPFLELVEEVVVVVPAGWKTKIAAQLESASLSPRTYVEEGGTTRQDSVASGLRKLTSDVKYVLVHDAARPFTSGDLIEEVMRGTLRHGACIPAVPASDTVKVVEDGKVLRTIDRSNLCLTQTPQGFKTELLKRALEAAEEEGVQGTDESSLVERLDAKVHVVAGEAANIKVTWMEDLQRG